MSDTQTLVQSFDNINIDNINIDDKFTTIEENENDEKRKDVNINIYRYKFDEKFTVELFNFAKIHQHDQRKDFKEAWTVWIEENDDIVNEETRRLKNLGYIGSVQDKMFKSARYYFRQKSTEKKAPKERRDYVGSRKELLDAMDKHIKDQSNKTDCKPSDGFDEFCKTNRDVLNDEVKMLCKNGFNDAVEIKNKIKKTYKNRYFLIVNK
jgi:uncharacterized protein (DUF934 family)